MEAMQGSLSFSAIRVQQLTVSATKSQQLRVSVTLHVNHLSAIIYCKLFSTQAIRAASSSCFFWVACCVDVSKAIMLWLIMGWDEGGANMSFSVNASVYIMLRFG